MMIMKFFLFRSLVHLCLIVSSSVMPQYGDIEQKQYDDFKLMSAFHKYLTIPTRETYSSFRFYVIEYYNRSPVDCLKLSERHRNDWVFKVIFWHALTEPFEYIDPATITPGYYHNVLEWISQKIRGFFLYCSCSDESKFKTELETVSLMVKSAERTASELKSLGNSDKLIRGSDDLVAIWKYLIRNISIDFANKTIDYYSLFRTFNDVSILIKTDSFPNGPSLRLSKRYALLWFYLHNIYYLNCNVIFHIHHHHKAFIVYLVMEFYKRTWGIYELYPNIIRYLFEKLYGNGSQQLDTILELFIVYNFENYRNWPGVSKNVSNYSELACYFTKNSDENYCVITWNVRALAELEAYLIQHGQKIDYSNK